jgi:hypothetical protein
MRYLTLGAIVCLCVGVGAAAQAQATDPQLMAPITKFLEAFNKGDMAGAAATHAAEADLAIIDEVPPYLWRGAQAFQTWAADLTSDDKKKASPIRRSRLARRRESRWTVPAPMSSCLRSTPSSRRAWRCERPRR